MDPGKWRAMLENTRTSNLESREVVVNDPALSPATNARLTEGLRVAVGASTVRVPSDRRRLSQGDRSGMSAMPLASNTSLMGMIGGFATVVVAGILAINLTNSYWLMALAIVVDIAGILVIASNVIRLTSFTERPDPILFIAMQDEGISNPEQYFTELVKEFARPSDADDEDRSTAVEEDHATAAKEQSASNTPTGGPSKAVGPGS